MPRRAVQICAAAPGVMVVENTNVQVKDFSALAVGDLVVRAGWFASVDPAVLIATTDRGQQVDLLVVPPSTAAGPAGKAMARAADPANHQRAQAILADLPATPAPTGAPNADDHPVWDNDGGTRS